MASPESSSDQAASVKLPPVQLEDAAAGTSETNPKPEPPPAESTSHESSISPLKEDESDPQEEKSKVVANASGTALNQVQAPQAPQVYITFLVISGRRRTMSFEPETTLGRVKELVWNTWPTEWEDERPLGPSYLRVLYLGKMLQDDDTLSKLKIPSHMPQSTPTPTPTIVHLSIRPYAPQNDNDLKKKRNKYRSSDASAQPPIGDTRDQGRGAGCCHCVIC